MIGLEPTFDEHLANLVGVFREVARVLRGDGTLWLNYGDAYAAAFDGRGGQGTNGAMAPGSPGVSGVARGPPRPRASNPRT